MILCRIVRHQMAAKGWPGCAECRLHSHYKLWWATAKVGVKKIYVWIMTQALPWLRPSLDVTLHRCTEAFAFSFILCCFGLCGVYLVRFFFFLLNMFFLPVLLCCSSSSKILESGFAGLRCVDVHECMLVAPPTEWVCVVLWLIPLFRGLMEFNTHKHSGLNT